MVNSRHSFIIFLTFIVALVLTLLPMPDWSGWLRPAWPLLVLIYWSIYIPERVNVGIAWIIGLVLDVLGGTLLAEHALALTIVIYLVARLHSRLRMFHLLQQGFMVFLFVLLYQLILYCIQGFIGDLPQGPLYWCSSVTSMLLWPWVYNIMQDCRRRFEI